MFTVTKMCLRVRREEARSPAPSLPGEATRVGRARSRRGTRHMPGLAGAGAPGPGEGGLLPSS